MPSEMLSKDRMNGPSYQPGGSSCGMCGGLKTALAIFGILTEIAAIGALVSLSIFLIRRSRTR